MQEIGLILTLAGSLGAALLFGYLTHRLGLSPIVGYLLAGIAIGPNTPGFIANPELAEQLAEVGVILLMFGVGLQFHVEELLAVRRVAVPGAAAGISFATMLGATAARAFGWDWISSLVFGLTLSVASTVVLVRVLSDAGSCTPPPAISQSGGSSSKTSSPSSCSCCCRRWSGDRSASRACSATWH